MFTTVYSSFIILNYGILVFIEFTVHPTYRVNSCIVIDRLMIELPDFHIPFLSFPNAGS